ncbi:MAG: hypothetical protein KAQ85_08565, partial [Thermodesulfovibrionia bacterium]|nr:hypothetical protein [Thermodesulfovibrionia bacterium]
MTKGELILWIRNGVSFFHEQPMKSDMLFYRWQIQEKKVSDRRKASIGRGDSLNFYSRDKYAKQFNATEDIKEKFALMKKMKPYEEELEAYMIESRAIAKAQKKVDKLYTQYESEVDRER